MAALTVVDLDSDASAATSRLGVENTFFIVRARSFLGRGKSGSNDSFYGMEDKRVTGMFILVYTLYSAFMGVFSADSSPSPAF